MNQLFYSIGGGIVHQIRREKRTTIPEVIVRGQRNIKQNRNWFYFKFSVESSSFILQQFNSLKFVSIIVAKYIIFPRANNGRSREKKNFWRSDLLTLSACTIGILSTLTYTEFDCAALLAMLEYMW